MIIENINIAYENNIIYEKFNIKFEDNKINCIIGKSGCGKTTLLNYIADELLEREVKLSYVFQNDNLIPWKTVYGNLKIIGKKYMEKYILDEEIDKLLKNVGLSEYKYYYPHQISGGMRQRVNFVRAIIGAPDIILMDEPFKSLDIKCKNEMIKMVKKINREKNTTIILVTHDKNEIINLANSVYLLGDRPIRILENIKENDIKNIIEKIM